MDLHVPSLYRTNSHDIVSPPEGSLSLGCLSLQPPFACECYVCLICNCPVCFIGYLFSKFSPVESFFNQHNQIAPLQLLYLCSQWFVTLPVVYYVLNAWQSLEFNLGDSNKFLSNLCIAELYNDGMIKMIDA